MNRKILAILALATVALTIGAASAFDLGGLVGDDASAQSEKVTIDGIDFNVPAGFKEDPDYARNGEVNETSGVEYTTWAKMFENDDGDLITIGVATYDGVKVNDTMPQYIGDKELEINGVNGYDYSDSLFHGFTYAKDGKLVIVSATDEALLEDVIIK